MTSRAGVTPGWENPSPGSLFKLKYHEFRKSHPNFPKPHEVGALSGRAPGFFFTYRHRFLVSFQIVEGGQSPRLQSKSLEARARRRPSCSQ